MHAVTPPAEGQEPPLIVRGEEAARLCGMGRSTWLTLHAMGKTPAALDLDVRGLRWSRAELEAWVAAGCPERREWQELKRRGGGKR